MIVQSFSNKDKKILEKKVLPTCIQNLSKRVTGSRKQVAVFDLDGTLLIGKSPQTALIEFFNLLPFERIIVTARTTKYHDSTVNQLKKHGVNFHTLITMPDNVDKDQVGAVA